MRRAFPFLLLIFSGCQDYNGPDCPGRLYDCVDWRPNSEARCWVPKQVKGLRADRFQSLLIAYWIDENGECYLTPDMYALSGFEGFERAPAGHWCYDESNMLPWDDPECLAINGMADMVEDATMEQADTAD